MGGWMPAGSEEAGGRRKPECTVLAILKANCIHRFHTVWPRPQGYCLLRVLIGSHCVTSKTEAPFLVPPGSPSFLGRQPELSHEHSARDVGTGVKPGG